MFLCGGCGYDSKDGGKRHCGGRLSPKQFRWALCGGCCGLTFLVTVLLLIYVGGHTAAAYALEHAQMNITRLSLSGLQPHRSTALASFVRCARRSRGFAPRTASSVPPH